VFPLTVATCSTIQNRQAFESIHVVGEPVLKGCLRAAMADGPVHAVKIGLVGVPRTLELILQMCEEHLEGVPVVVDPVLSATAGGMSTGEDLVESYRRCLARVTVVTPNHAEAARLAPGGVETLSGCAVLLSDGHGDGEVVEDRLLEGNASHSFRHPRLAVGPVHGTGCALSTGVAAALASGCELPAACRAAVEFVSACLARTPRSVDGLPVPIRI